MVSVGNQSDKQFISFVSVRMAKSPDSPRRRSPHSPPAPPGRALKLPALPVAAFVEPAAGLAAPAGSPTPGTPSARADPGPAAALVGQGRQRRPEATPVLLVAVCLAQVFSADNSTFQWSMNCIQEVSYKCTW